MKLNINVFKRSRSASPHEDKREKKRPSRISKNIILCFDGTAQDPTKAIQPIDTEGNPEDSSISNVVKLHLLLGGDFTKDAVNSFYYMPDQVSLYYSGVGTYGGKYRRLFNTALGTQDVDSIIDEALEDLREIHQPGDKVFALGFSRGAAIARRFCGAMSKESDLSHVKVEMLIAFDTVASIGLPDFSTTSRPSSDVLFEDRKVAPNVLQALHCVSLDDKRRAFQPTLMNAEDRVTEVWFAGAHSDIGGGYYNDGLSDTVLQFVLDEIKRRNVGLHLLETDQVKLAEISKEAGDEVEIEDDDFDIDPNHFDVSHEQPMRPWHYHRKAVVIRNDEIVPGERPIVHHSVAKRVAGISYRPQSLAQQPHKILYPDGTYHHFNGVDEIKALQ